MSGGIRVSARAVANNRRSARARYHQARGHNQDIQKLYRDKRKRERPFIGWDGEGYTEWVCTGPTLLGGYYKHNYMLFGASTGEHITGPDLGTAECLDLMLKVEADNPNVAHVGFAFEYDVNMILKDLSWRHLALLNAYGGCCWIDPKTRKKYYIEHIPHKIFSVSDRTHKAKLSDTFGFFHCSYIAALKKYGFESDPRFSHIESGKADRPNFTYADIKKVKSYWLDEISLFPPLIDKIREAAYGGGYLVTDWYGPGALANYLLHDQGVSEWKSRNVPKEVSNAIRHAYAGGHFEGWLCGLYLGDIYTADLNSAYIAAIASMPRLDRGKWIRQHPDSIDGKNLPRFGLYHLEFDAGDQDYRLADRHGFPVRPFPLFHRDKRGCLRWPPRTKGWYWTPEASIVIRSPRTTVLDAWVFDDDGSNPFEFVRSVYARRVKLQHEGNPAEKAYKWALAAMYGAFARRVGWDRENRTAPKSHELAWAGYITSWCRAAVFGPADDVYKRGRAYGLVSIDTDGVTSTIPFDPKTLEDGLGNVTGEGEGLGQWKLEHYTGILYWQNGIYWLRDEEGNWIEPKTRGVPRGSIPLDAALEALDAAEWHTRPYYQPRIEITRTGFIGYRQALRGQFDKWRTWVTHKHTINFGGTLTGKGFHMNENHCALCNCAEGPKPIMHTIFHTIAKDEESQPHKLPWLEDQPELLENMIFEAFNWIPKDGDM